MPVHRDFKRLADLLRRYNAIGDEIAGVIGRPAERGHAGKYIPRARRATLECGCKWEVTLACKVKSSTCSGKHP